MEPGHNGGLLSHIHIFKPDPVSFLLKEAKALLEELAGRSFTS